MRALIFALPMFCLLTACGRGGKDASNAEKSQAAQEAEASLSVTPPSPKHKTAPDAFKPFFQKHPDLKTLNVPIKVESLLSLDKALAQKGYGEVTASDFKPVYVCEPKKIKGHEAPAQIAFTDLEKFRAYARAHYDLGGTAHIPMTLHQLVKATLGDDVSAGVVFDPGSDSEAVYDDYQISILDLYLKSLPNQPADLPLSVQTLTAEGPALATSKDKK